MKSADRLRCAVSVPAARTAETMATNRTGGAESPPEKRRKTAHHIQGDYEFVQPLPDCFQTECSICLLVLRSPHIISCCGHNFCKECIEGIQKDRKNCPLCNKDGFTLIYNRAHDVSLKQLEVFCTHREIGCEWQGKLEMLHNHLNVYPEPEYLLEGCAFVEVQCSHDGCALSFPRSLMDKHQLEECPQRPFFCEHCHEYKSTFQDVTTNHLPVCRAYPVVCPNLCSLHDMERQHLEQHLTEDCPLQEVECDFKHAGCESRLPRKDMPSHLSDSTEVVRHMFLLARENQRLSQQNQELIKQIDRLSEHVQIAPVQLVFPDFVWHKRKKDEWVSGDFYSHPQGYKMSLSVVANGEGDGVGTHVSCYIYLRLGNYDNQLKWPFKGEVMIELLNQREDNQHHTRRVNFANAKSDAITRPNVEKGRSSGWGYERFISHDALDYSGTTGCEYLMNDCLYFRIHVNM